MKGLQNFYIIWTVENDVAHVFILGINTHYLFTNINSLVYFKFINYEKFLFPQVSSHRTNFILRTSIKADGHSLKCQFSDSWTNEYNRICMSFHYNGHSVNRAHTPTLSILPRFYCNYVKDKHMQFPRFSDTLCMTSVRY